MILNVFFSSYPREHSKQEFVNHASEFHPESVDHLNNISDGSLDDVYCPWHLIPKWHLVPEVKLDVKDIIVENNDEFEGDDEVYKTENVDDDDEDWFPEVKKRKKRKFVERPPSSNEVENSEINKGPKNPRDIENLGEFANMEKGTKQKYLKTWYLFCENFDISMEKPPIEENLLEFFKKQSERKVSAGYMNAMYSHINKACFELYGWKLQRWPEIFGYITQLYNGTNRTTKKSDSKNEEFLTPENVEIKLDPKNIAFIGEFYSMPSKLKKRYVNTWLDFCVSYNISTNKPPKIQDFQDFFKRKKESGHAFKAMSSFLQIINKACIALYGLKLKKAKKENFYNLRWSKDIIKPIEPFEIKPVDNENGDNGDVQEGEDGKDGEEPIKKEEFR